jgi:hypothetical protein
VISVGMGDSWCPEPWLMIGLIVCHTMSDLALAEESFSYNPRLAAVLDFAVVGLMIPVYVIPNSYHQTPTRVLPVVSSSSS